MRRRINGTAKTSQREQQASAVGTVTPPANGIATPEGHSLRATANNPTGAVTALAISGVVRTSQGDKSAPQVWYDDDRALGLEAVAKWRSGEIKARTWEQAVKLHIPPGRYTSHKDGHYIDANHVIRNLKNRAEREGKPIY